jgi:O-antigen ligase
MLVLVPLLFWRGALEPFELCKVAAIQATALALLVLAGWGAGRIAQVGRRLRELTADPVSWAMLLGAAAALASTLGSLSPRTSLHGHPEHLQGLGTVLALLVIYFASRAACRDPGSIRLLVWGVAGGVLAAVAYSLVQIADLDPFLWEQTSAFADWTRPVGTLGHPNYLAGYLVMAVPLLVWLAARSGRHLAVGLLLLVALSGVVVVAALSRAGWLAGGLGGVLVLALRPWRAGPARFSETRLNEQGRGRVCPLLLVTLSLLLAAGCLSALRLFPPLAERLRHLTEMASRRALWGTAWHVFLARPVTGCGLDAFDLGFCLHRGPEYWQREWGLIPTRAHNDFLNVLATQGAPGAAAFGLLAVALVWACVRVWRGGVERPLTAALAAAVVGWYAQNLFGFPVAATASLLSVLAGMLSALAWPPAEHAADSRSEAAPAAPWALRVPLALAGALAAVLLAAQPYRASCLCRQGEELLAAAAPQQALARQEQAVLLDPGRDLLWIKLADTALACAAQASNDPEHRRLLLRAREAVERACALVPARAQNHVNRARALDVLAREGLLGRDAVLRAYDEALARDPCNSQFLAEAGRAAHAAGLLPRARAYLERGVAIDPTFGLLHSELGSILLDEKRYREAQHQFHLAMSGDFHGDSEEQDRAWSLNALAFLHIGDGKQVDAMVIAERLLERHPDSVPLHLLHARACEQCRRRDLALAEYRWVLGACPTHPQARAGLARVSAWKN